MYNNWSTMEAFYWIVLTIAVVFLILILTFIGILMTRPKTGDGAGVAYPPVTTTCPDYWTVDGSSCVIPAITGINVGSLYGSSSAGSISNKATKGGTATLPGLSSDNKSINFNDKGWSGLGSTSLCGQKAWANSFNVMWDGVSNYNSC